MNAGCFLTRFCDAKNSKILFASICVIYSCSSCGGSVQPPTSSDFGTGDCTLEQLEWNSVVEGFDQERSLEILTNLQAAAKANPNNVITEAGFNVDFAAAINNIINVTNRKEFMISQDVQDVMVALRRLGCDIQDGLFDNNLKAAQDKYLEIIDRVGSTKKKLIQ